jgi:hypothetical protein
MDMGVNSKPTRRTVLRQVCTSAVLSTAAFSSGVKSQEETDQITVPRDNGFNSEVRFAKELPGVQVEQTDANYIIRINHSELDSPSPEAKQEAESELKQTLETSRRELEMNPPEGSVIGLGSIDRDTDENGGGTEFSVILGEILENISVSPIQLGRDESLRNMEIGGTSSSKTGSMLSLGSSHFITDENRATASLLAIAGVGNERTASWIGTPFEVEGTGSEIAMVEILGEYKGKLTAAGQASSSGINVQFGIRDITTGAVYSKDILRDQASTTWKTIHEEFHQGMPVLLESDSSYVCYAKIETEINSFGLGEASADFGPEDNDRMDPPGGLKVDEIYIRF